MSGAKAARPWAVQLAEAREVMAKDCYAAVLIAEIDRLEAQLQTVAREAGRAALRLWQSRPDVPRASKVIAEIESGALVWRDGAWKERSE